MTTQTVGEVIACCDEDQPPENWRTCDLCQQCRWTECVACLGPIHRTPSAVWPYYQWMHAPAAAADHVPTPAATFPEDGAA